MSGGLWNLALTSGLTLLGGLFIGYYGGRWLDERAGTGPWLTLAGTLLGIVAGFRVLLRDILREGTGTGSKDKGAGPDRDSSEGSGTADRG